MGKFVNKPNLKNLTVSWRNQNEWMPFSYKKLLRETSSHLSQIKGTPIYRINHNQWNEGIRQCISVSSFDEKGNQITNISEMTAIHFILHNEKNPQKILLTLKEMRKVDFFAAMTFEKSFFATETFSRYFYSPKNECYKNVEFLAKANFNFLSNLNSSGIINKGRIMNLTAASHSDSSIGEQAKFQGQLVPNRGYSMERELKSVLSRHLQSNETEAGETTLSIVTKNPSEFPQTDHLYGKFPVESSPDAKIFWGCIPPQSVKKSHIDAFQKQTKIRKLWTTDFTTANSDNDKMMIFQETQESTKEKIIKKVMSKKLTQRDYKIILNQQEALERRNPNSEISHIIDVTVPLGSTQQEETFNKQDEFQHFLKEMSLITKTNMPKMKLIFHRPSDVGETKVILEKGLSNMEVDSFWNSSRGIYTDIRPKKTHSFHEILPYFYDGD